MNESILNSWWELTSCITTLVLIYCAFEGVRRHLEKRARDLRNCRTLLDTHYAELDKFIEDVASPESLKDLLVDLSDCMGEHDSAKLIVDRLIGPVTSKPKIDPKAEELLGQLRDLQGYRPDLATAFRTSMAAGMGAMFFRWPDMAPKRDAFIARYTTQDELVFATRTVSRDHNHHPNMDGLAVA